MMTSVGKDVNLFLYYQKLLHACMHEMSCMNGWMNVWTCKLLICVRYKCYEMHLMKFFLNDVMMIPRIMV